jgi:hypothetical protein
LGDLGEFFENRARGDACHASVLFNFTPIQAAPSRHPGVGIFSARQPVNEETGMPISRIGMPLERIFRAKNGDCGSSYG